jgi:hypothetical protein
VGLVVEIDVGFVLVDELAMVLDELDVFVAAVGIYVNHLGSKIKFVVGY